MSLHNCCAALQRPNGMCRNWYSGLPGTVNAVYALLFSSSSICQNANLRSTLEIKCVSSILDRMPSMHGSGTHDNCCSVAPGTPEAEDNVGLSRVRFLQSAVSDAVAGPTSPDQTRHHPRLGNTIYPYSQLSPQKHQELFRGLSGLQAHQEQFQKPSRSRCQGSTTRPKIGRLAPAAVLTIEAYGCTGHSSSSTSSRHPRPSKLTEAPVSRSPFILRPVISTSANTRGSVMSSLCRASMI
ncbi:hypothetical protein ACLKA6_004505 [Drosophila palustris]